MGRESDQARVVAVALADELTDIQLALPAHLGRTGVAEVGVVFPDDDFGVRDVIRERRQRLCHVLVSQVPRRHASREHRSVITLGVENQPRILLRKKVIVGVIARAAELNELLHDFVLARLRDAEGGRVTVGLRILAGLLEAGVAISRPLRRFGIDLLEILDHVRDR